MKKAFMDVSKILEEKKFSIDKKKGRGYLVHHFCVDYKSEGYIKRCRGDYFTITFDSVSLHQKGNAIKKELMKILRILFKDLKTTDPLIIGLGNSSILCDSLGVSTTNKVMATNHFTDFLNMPKVALFNPEVVEKTGISSYSLIEMVVRKLKPSMIIIFIAVIIKLKTNPPLYIMLNKKYAKGNMNITLSILSNNPPCPGIKLLKSLILQLLLTLEAAKSPI